MPGTSTRQFIAGALLLVIAGSADAAICDGSTASACGSGELFLNVWNETSAKSYSLDLGVTADQLANGVITTFSWNLADNGLAPLFGSFLTALGNGSPMKYNVAANNTYGNVISNPNFGVLSTFSNSEEEVQAVQPSVVLSGISGTMSSNVRGRANNLNFSAVNDHPGATATEFSVNLDEISDASEFSYFDDPSWGLDLGGAIGGLITDTDVGNPIDLYLMGWAGTRQLSRFDLLGHFNFSSDGLLTFGPGAASAVPVPAAIWLLGPALFAIAGTARRRRL